MALLAPCIDLSKLAVYTMPLLSHVSNVDGQWHTGPHALSSISCLAASLAILLRTDILVSKCPQVTAAAAAYGR